MGKSNQSLLAFNRGIISPLALARVDITKVALSAEIQTNWLPRLLGSMMLRPGPQYIGATYNNDKAINIPFVFSKADTAAIEITKDAIRVWDDGEDLVTRVAVLATITNGTFAGNITGWTDADEVGTTSQWASGNYMELLGNSLNYAKRYQLVSLNPADIGKEHAIRIVVNRGPILFRIGLSPDGEEYIKEQTLETGTHSLAFSPETDFYVTFYSNLDRIVLLQSVAIESAGVMILPSPYTEDQLKLVRWDQSADITYLSCKGLQQRKIERRSQTSWSIVLYYSNDGPVRIENTSEITLTAGALTGNTTLTANKPLFKTNQVEGLYKLISNGQNITDSFSAANDFSGYIIVTGVGTSRQFSINITGTFTATLTIQQSFDEGSSWLDYTTYTTAGLRNIDDGADNQTIWYRIGIKSSNYTSGTANILISYSLGSITGYCRITSYVSTTVVNIEILKALGSTNATANWAEGEWSDYRGWPSALALAEGRLFQAGKGKLWGSVSDAYQSYSDEVEGDSGLISRNIGWGAVSDINWMLALYRLFMGCDTSEKGVKTTSFEEPITPTNFRIVDPSTQGSAQVAGVRLDKKGIFLQASQTRVFDLDYDQSTLDYSSTELTKACPEIGEPSIVKIAIQRQPDTTIHCIRSDGKAALLLFDVLENLKCWILYETDGEFEDVDIYQGDLEDRVYYTIKRTIDGQTVRYREKFAMQNECQGQTLNKQADSFIIYEGAATNIITGLDHLEGKEVVVWADGKDYSPDNLTYPLLPPSITNPYIQKTYTVTSGAITLDVGVTVSNAIVGLPYKARYKSSKLAYASGSPLNELKKVNAVGFIARNIWWKGIKAGKDFDNLYNLPEVIDGRTITASQVYEDYDHVLSAMGGEWNTDSRLCLEAQAPRPCTLLAATIAITTNDKQ